LNELFMKLSKFTIVKEKGNLSRILLKDEMG